MSIKIFLSKEERKQKRLERKAKRLQKKEERRKKLSTRKWLLPVIIVSIVVYAGLDVFLQIKTQMEISPTLTTCWFTFWAVELINLASITKKKVDIDYESGYTENLNQLHQENKNDANDPNDDVIGDNTEESEDEINERGTDC